MTSTHSVIGGTLCFEEFDLGPAAKEAGAQPETSAQPASPPPAPVPADHDPSARLVSELAVSLARVLAGVFRQLNERQTDENRALGAAVEQQGQRLSDAVEQIAGLAGRIEYLVETASEQQSAGAEAQQSCGQLAAGLESLRESHGRREGAVETLQNQLRELSDSVTERLDALLYRLGLQQEDLTEMKTATSELSPRVNQVVERLDRQAEAIRSLWDAQSHREAALSGLMEVLTRWKTSGAAAGAEPQPQM